MDLLEQLQTIMGLVGGNVNARCENSQWRVQLTVNTATPQVLTASGDTLAAALEAAIRRVELSEL